MKIQSISILILLLVLPMFSYSQSKQFTREGHIQFLSVAEAENIEANNYKVTSIIDFATGKMEFAVLMKAFEFEKALMEEHFNENYVESELFPKSTFKGAITNLDEVNLEADGEYSVNVEGALTIHGVTKDITAPATITVAEGVVSGTTSFTVKVADYDISIPKVVIKNIAEEITVNVNCKYQELKK
ncbi:MAG: YceI family protein [Bacteroidia bacterium]|nr:YceI family protein [Bacteroidia bacterium]